MHRLVHALVVVSGLVGCGLHARAARADAPTPAFKSGTFDPPRAAPDFELQGSDGKALTLARFKGKVVVLAFGFTQCTKVCPVTLSKLAALTQKLGTASSDVQVVYVTVDPERDTAERLRAYLQAFDKSFVGGTGTAAQLDVVRHDYGILAKKVALAGGATYEVHHSSFLYLVDREGKLRVLVPFGKTIEDIHNDVQLLLKG